MISLVAEAQQSPPKPRVGKSDRKRGGHVGMHQTDILVHNYTANATSSHSTPPDALLEIGRDLIQKAVGLKGWSTLTHKFDVSHFSTPRPGHAYIFSQVLPVIDRGTYGPLIYREWGTPLDADDILFSLNELKDFESTDLQFLPAFRRRDIPASHDSREYPLAEHSSRTPKHTLPTSETLVSKRRRVDISSLHTVIPPPHFHGAPSVGPQLPAEARITPYRKTIPHPISPHIPSTVRDYLRTPYAQCAWVVPVRGVLPWEGCSSAVVLAPTARNEDFDPDLPQPANGNCQITWTYMSLLDFWLFLLAVRDANTLGPIALSFHPSSTDYIKSHPHPIVPDVSVNSQDAPKVAVGQVGTADNNFRTNHVCHTPFLAVDHIKIYHEAACTMLIRNVLDAWAYSHAASGTVSDQMQNAGRIKQKIRVLKGAKLVLVDERSKGVLIS